VSTAAAQEPIGINAERKSLEEITKPITAVAEPEGAPA
jgi:hypothetical protein